jgi:hypothetical protein
MCTSHCVFIIKDAIDLNNNNTIEAFNKKMTKPLIYEKKLPLPHPQHTT